MNASRFVLGVDLDGVCADFYEGLRPITAEWLGVDIDTLPRDVSHGLKEWGIDSAPGGYQALHRFAVTQRNLFGVLRPIDRAPRTLRMLSAHDVRIRIITNRLFVKYFHREAVRQTIEWLDYHDIPYWDLCFMRDKGAVGADLYLEDAPENVEGLRQGGYPTIVYTNSTNRHLAGPRADSWEQAGRMVLEALAEWRTASGEAGSADHGKQRGE
jgi:5'(3')-deoxyribonucleotidase